MNPLFISFYSGDSYYENCSRSLLNNCRNLGIEIEIEKSGGYREYWKNTLHKPSFIYDKLKSLKKDLVWIDVDTNILSYHECFKKWDCDILFSSHTGNIEGIKASPLCIKYNERTLDFMRDLKDLCDQKIRSNDIDLDHDVLKYEILPKFKGRICIDIMDDTKLKASDFSDGAIINNGISRVRDKSIYMSEVIRKNSKRNSDFQSLLLKDFIV